MGSSIAIVRVGVGIGNKIGIGASFSKNIFRPSKIPFLLYRALSIVYSRGVGK